MPVYWVITGLLSDSDEQHGCANQSTLDFYVLYCFKAHTMTCRWPCTDPCVEPFDTLRQRPNCRHFANIWMAFSWMKRFEFCIRFHWSLFLRFESTIIRHWFRYNDDSIYPKRMGLTRPELEQLVRLRSEIPPAAPWLIILVIHIRSKVKTRQSRS